MFQTIPAGETVEATFDVAHTHDLSAGGAIYLSAEGALSYAAPNTTELAGVVPFSSNVLSAVEVDGAAAAAARSRFLDDVTKRSVVQSDCTGTKLTALRTAESSCASLARAAATAASSGSASKVEEYCEFSPSPSSLLLCPSAHLGR